MPPNSAIAKLRVARRRHILRGNLEEVLEFEGTEILAKCRNFLVKYHLKLGTVKFDALLNNYSMCSFMRHVLYMNCIL